MMRLFALATSVLLATAPVWAEPYWYAYDADDDFPENEGWERWVSDPAPERWLEDGALFIDSRGLVGSTDDYGISFDSGVDPAPGETFIMSWRLMVEEVTHRDPGVYVHSDEAWSVAFIFDTESLSSFYEPTVYVDIEPYVYHEYEMRSSDMRSYELYIDGDLAIDGVFFQGFFPLGVGFGDIVSSTSLASWDYFRFGVVPEPSALWLFIAGLAACVLRTVRGSNRQVVFLPVLVCLLAASVTAEPYWITYEGNDFPENEGWRRNINAAGGADRWIEDGALVIDSLHNAAIWDNYVIEDIADPEPGEMFVCEWRMLSEEALFYYDAGVTIARTAVPGYVFFVYDVDEILVWRENELIPITPGEWHAYRFETNDMVGYTLSIDEEEVFSGMFEDQTFLQSFVGWGDKANGAASLTRWDYVRFGVVPEPQSLTYGILVALALWRARFRNREEQT